MASAACVDAEGGVVNSVFGFWRRLPDAQERLGFPSHRRMGGVCRIRGVLRRAELMATVLVRASQWMLLVRFGDQWFRYDSWQELFRDLRSDDRLRIQVAGQ